MSASPEDLTAARQVLLEELQAHALLRGDFVLASGRQSTYLIDAKKAIMQPRGFLAMGQLVAAEAELRGATAVGGMTMGADPIACSALAGGADVKAFFVRKEPKDHGAGKQIEGPDLVPGEKCLMVEDVVTTGGSTVRAIEVMQAAGYKVVGVVGICDRLAGGAAALEAAAGAPFTALTTIDEVHPDRDDR
ncbi:MAG: orotate phosphoribosyltransferase [Solirubrobacterales bacterium]|nr:orotate phosphoribosyltransferase [Solirubrobacterales bacterium]